MRFLIVDDDAKSRGRLSRFLVMYGQCDIASTGKEAISKFILSCDTSPYDFVFLDLQLPDDDGYTVLKGIKEYVKKQARKHSTRTRVIIVTRLCDPESIERAFKEQCDLYLIKPFIDFPILKVVNS